MESFTSSKYKGAPDLAVSFLIAISNCAPFPKGTYLIESALKPFGIDSIHYSYPHSVTFEVFNPHFLLLS